MLSLQNILSSEGQEFLDNLFNKQVIVNEKLNAATLSFKKEHSSEMDLNRKLTFYKGSGSNKKEITIADKVMTTFYSAGMTYLNNLSKLIIDRIPANWTFVCRYFPNHQPSFINYSVLPKNNLVLSYIVTSGGTIIDDVDDIRSWAEMFDIAYQEPVYKGFLTQYQKEKLNDYLKGKTGNKESFSRFIITLLNPSLTHSLYQNDGFDSPIDGFIFKFLSDDGFTKPMSAKLIDPYMTSIISKNKSGKAFKDNTDVLLSDFAVFMTGQDMDSIILTSKSESERYLELFYRLFNRYIKYKKSQLEDFDVDTNDIVKESIDVDFSVDIDKITNETTKKLLKDNPEYRNIFKTLLGSFKSKKPDNYKSLVMSPGVVRLFNDMVDKITAKASTGEEKDPLSFTSYLETIRKKDINALDINNAPGEVQDANKFEDVEPLEIKGETKDALSFADFKKKDKDNEDENKEKKELKSIEDMIKDLQKNVKSLSDKIEKSEEEKDDDKKSEERDSDKDEKSDDKKDDKKSEEKEDESKDDGNKSDDKKDEDEKSDDQKEEDTDDDKGDDNGDDDQSKDDKKETNPLSGL
jgi:hypothetical protein